MNVQTIERPKTLMADALWLQHQLSSLTQYVGNGGQLTLEIHTSMVWLQTELTHNQLKTAELAKRILSKLPTCEECGKMALYSIKYGPYYCEEHSQLHPTAQKVDWYQELVTLGPDVNP